jgi:hypothetical protein
VGERRRIPRGWRTIRQRKRRANAAQVSAVAVVLGLLLFTSMLYSFVLNAIPNEMTQNEFNHELLLEDQLGMLQGDVLAEAATPHAPAQIVTPLSLGSAADPPFAPPSTSTLEPEPENTSLRVTYTTAHVVQTPPNWGVGTCSTINVSCLSPNIYENITGLPGHAYNFLVAGAAPSYYLNFTGNGSSIQIDWVSLTMRYVNISIQGSSDRLKLIDTSLVASPGANVFVQMFGENDTYVMGISQPSLVVHTWFVGTAPFTNCPAENLSQSDKFFWNGSLHPPSNAAVTTSWWNNIGYVSGPTTFNLGLGATLTFRNQTGAIACAFTKLYSSQYFTPSTSGIVIHLNNRYMVPADLVYDEGAVILSHPGLGSIMVDPPNFNFLTTSAGVIPDLELMNVVVNNTGEAGAQNAAVMSHLLSTQTFNLTNSFNSSYVLTGIFMNVTTEYPYAWASFFDTFGPQLVPGGVQCTEPTHFPNGFSCLVPPIGGSSSLSVLMITPMITITWVTVGLTIL